MSEFADAPLPPEPYGAQVAQMLEMGRKLTDPETTAEWWSPNGVSSGGVTCWTPKDGTPGARGDGIVHYPLHAIVEALNDISLRREYDSQFAGGTYGAEIDASLHSRLIHLRFSGILIVAPRDFSTLTFWRRNRDSSVFLLAASLPEPAAPPPAHGTVRGHIEIGGWLVRPVAGTSADDADSCHVTAFMRSDLKGSIPSRIIAIVLAQQAGIVKLVENMLKKKYGDATPAEIRARMGPLRN